MWKSFLFLAFFFISITTEAGPKEFYYQRAVQRLASTLNKDFFPFLQAQLPQVLEVEAVAEIFVQKLDHFNARDRQTFQQRYYVNSNYASGANAPVLFYICGESSCTSAIFAGAIQTHAKNLGAHMVALEHRYYGKSQPFANYETPNLRYLSMPQALADLAEFQQYAVKKFALHGKWISMGGSYPGMLAAFYRLKYPQLNTGALASSAPVRVENNFEKYDYHSAKVLGAECLARVQTVVRHAEELFDKPAELLAFKRLFEAEALVDSVDFLYFLADYGPAIATQFGKHVIFCSSLASSQNVVDGYVKFIKHIYMSWGMNALSMSFQAAKETSIPSNELFGMRPWFYQSCTEFGFWQTAYHDPRFSARSTKINEEFHRHVCKVLFNLGTLADTKKVNEMFYDQLIAGSAEQILFTNGSNDPWSELSITPDMNTRHPSYMIQNGAHCDDLSAPSNSDSVSLKKSRDLFFSGAKAWLKN